MEGVTDGEKEGDDCDEVSFNHSTCKTVLNLILLCLVNI